MSEGPRSYTTEETKAQFLAHVRGLIRYWSNEHTLQPHERVEGVAFSICSTLDGCSMGVPAFAVIPSPAKEDEAYHREQGENWYDPEIIGDIAGGLHEQLYVKAREDAPLMTPEMRVLWFAQREKDERRKTLMRFAAVACIEGRATHALAAADHLACPAFSNAVRALPEVTARIVALDAHAAAVIDLIDAQRDAAELRREAGYATLDPYVRLYDMATHIQRGTRAVAWLIFEQELSEPVRRFAEQVGQGNRAAWLSYVGAYSEVDRLHQQFAKR